MKNLKFALFFFSTVLIIGCNSSKQAEKSLNYGNYDQAIEQSIKIIKNAPNSNRAKKAAPILKKAYDEANNETFYLIKELTKDKNPESLKNLYDLYILLNNRQRNIIPILPIKNEEDKTLIIQIVDYSENINNVRSDLSEYLYDKSQNLLNKGTKLDAREAYYDLEYLKKINPNYKNTNTLITKAAAAGTDFVFLKMQNLTNKTLPSNYKKSLITITPQETFNEWVVIDANRRYGVRYNYNVDLDLTKMEVSKEKLISNIVTDEVEYQDGYKSIKDRYGNIVVDSLGRIVEIPNIIKKRVNLEVIEQHKDIVVEAKVNLYNKGFKELISTEDIGSSIVFKNQYIIFSGDCNLLSKKFQELCRNEAKEFPTDDELIYATGKELKGKLKASLNQSFKN